MSLKDRYENASAPLFNNSVYDTVDPIPVKPFPREQDYSRGFMIRYFLKRKKPSGRLPFEVDERQYRIWDRRGSGIPRGEFDGIKIKWKLTGNVKKEINSLGYPVARGVEETNQNLIRLYNDTLRGLDRVLSDPLEYYKQVT